MTNAAAKKVLIMAGGTGGHVYPGLATAAVLRDQGVEVEWLGSIQGIENQLVPAADLPLHRISVAGLRGKGKLSLLLAPFKLLKAVWQARKVLAEVKPDAVLGMGGFASGPGGLAAWLKGIPVLVHEQNAIPGLTNKILAKLAKRVMEAFPGAFPVSTKALCTGNPIRRTIVDLPEPATRMAVHANGLNILVIGGSLGAQAINQAMPAALAKIPEPQRPHVWHQTGTRNLEQTQAWYGQAGVAAQVVPFIDDMNGAYEWADLVVCRAGALTVSELSAAGVASILVPYPYAVDDHQTANARYLTGQGAGILVPQTELDADKLVSLFEQLADRQQLLSMAQKARALGRQDASELVAQQCMQWAGVQS